MALFRPKYKDQDGNMVDLPLDASSVDGHAVEDTGITSNTSTLPTTHQVKDYVTGLPVANSRTTDVSVSKTPINSITSKGTLPTKGADTTVVQSVSTSVVGSDTGGLVRRSLNITFPTTVVNSITAVGTLPDYQEVTVATDIDDQPSFAGTVGEKS